MGNGFHEGRGKPNFRGERRVMFKNSYFSRKLHSLLGVIPVGFFLIEHLLTNYSAAKGGPESFLEHVEWLHSLPLVLALEIFGIWIPLAYHAIYGLYVAYTARNNVNNYGYFRNVMFFLQRVTGVVTFLFVAWHFFSKPVFKLRSAASSKWRSARICTKSHRIRFTSYCM